MAGLWKISQNSFFVQVLLNILSYALDEQKENINIIFANWTKWNGGWKDERMGLKSKPGGRNACNLSEHICTLK